MGQHLSIVNSLIVDWANKDTADPKSNSMAYDNDNENINLFLSMKTFADTTTNETQDHNDVPIWNSEKLLTEHIQKYLLKLTTNDELTLINTKINKLLIENGFIPVADRYRKAFQEMKVVFGKQQQLRESLQKKLGDDNDTNQFIVSEPCTESSENETDALQFPYFAVKLLASLLLESVKINEKVDPSISSQIIILANQLCEQIPIKTLSSFEQSPASRNFISKSLQPLISCINELSLSTDPIVATPAVEILLRFLIAQASFRDLLFIIHKLIFHTIDTYNLRNLFKEMNDCFTDISKQYEQVKQQLDTKTLAG